MSTLSQRQIIARREVIDFLIDACVNSPLACDTEDFAANSHLDISGEDLDDALRDVRVALEAMRGFLS